jgi:hypothetical protein
MEIRFAFSIVASTFLTGVMLVACGSRTELSSPRGFVDGDDAGGIDASEMEAGEADTPPEAGVDAIVVDAGFDAGELVTTRRMLQVPGTANLYRASSPSPGDTPPVMATEVPVCGGTKVQITATGCVVSKGPICVGADGNNGGPFNGLPVYSLIGQWGRSPNGLTAATAAGPAFFVGSNNVLAAPSGPGPYFLYLAENDGIFSDNSRAYSVTVTYTQPAGCR